MGPAPCRPATKAPPTMSRRKPSSSAATSKVCGTVTPSALAVLRLITSSNLVGCWTGRSPGLSPFRIRSTFAADPGYFSSLYGKLIPFDVNQKTGSEVARDVTKSLGSGAAGRVAGQILRGTLGGVLRR